MPLLVAVVTMGQFWLRLYPSYAANAAADVHAVASAAADVYAVAPGATTPVTGVFFRPSLNIQNNRSVCLLRKCCLGQINRNCHMAGMMFTHFFISGIDGISLQ